MTLLVVLGAVAFVAGLSVTMPLAVRSVKAPLQKGSPPCFMAQFAALVQISELRLREIEEKTGVPRATVDGWKSGKNLPQNKDQLMSVVRMCRQAALGLNPAAPVARLTDSDWEGLLDEARRARSRQPPPPGGPGSPGVGAIIHGLLRADMLWARMFRLVVAAGVLWVVLVAVLIIAEPPTQSASLRIMAPDSMIDCPSSAPQCQFQVTGHAISPGSGNQIIVLVYPVKPSGGGWFVQWPPAGIQISGDWLQSPAYIGSKTAPARNGDTLRVEAVLVPADAAYYGTSLERLEASGRSIADVRQITGLVTQSDPVQITVRTR